MTSRIQTIESHRLSDGSLAEITRLGRTYNFNRYSGPIEIPECEIAITKDKAYQMLADTLKNDALELDSYLS